MTEQWRPIPRFNKYEVSNHGRVRSWRSNGKTKRWRSTPKILKPYWVGYATKTQYQAVSLQRNNKRFNRKVHRLVLIAFAGPAPPGHQGAHNDGDVDNNHIDNLRWATPRENCADKLKHGTHTYGSKMGSAKLTERLVIEIRRQYERGNVTKAWLAQQFGVSGTNIGYIIQRKTWTHI